MNIIHLTSSISILFPKLFFKHIVLIVEDSIIDEEDFLLLGSKRCTTGILASLVRFNT